MAKFTLMLLVKNEADRYLRQMLDSASEYVDEIVVLDDGSTDNTFEICKSYNKVVSISRTSDQNVQSFDINEASPRQRLFEMTVATNPSWILALDADEIMEDRFKREIRGLLDNPGGNYWFSVIFHHFWHSMTHYRVDKLWKPSAGLRIFKYVPGYQYTWKQSRLHCGSLPDNIFRHFPGYHTNYRVKHYGYSNEEHALKKYYWYIERDPNSEMCPRSHYESIRDTNPILQEWIE